MRVKKSARLLEDEDVLRWYNNVRRGSVVNSGIMLRTLTLFCEQNGVTPKQLLKIGIRKVEDLLLDHVTRMEKEGKAPGYIINVLKAVKSWLSFNGIQLKRRIKVSNSTSTPTTENERVPTHEELRTILLHADERTKVAVALMAFSGLRPMSLGNAPATDGLRVGDIPDLKIENGKVVFNKVPAMTVVRAPLSKTKHKYFTFLCQEGCEYLKAYLESRIAKGEILTSESPVIAVKGAYHSSKKKAAFVETSKIMEGIRQAIRVRFPWRPYVLRAYFDTEMIQAESHGKISHPYVQFFMGHKGDMEARYTTNKGRLPEDLIEDMRRCYKECEPYLSTIAQPLEQASIVKEAKIEALKSIAKSLLGIDLMEVKIAKEKELGKELTPDEQIELFENEVKKMRESADPQKIVGENELEQYLSDGWEFVSVLPSQRILIRK